MTLEVLILAARNLTIPEALAVGRRLGDREGVRVRYLDARLVLRDCLTSPARTNAGRAPRLIDRIRELLLRSSFTRALLLLRGLLADRARLRRMLTDAAPDAVVIYDDRRARPDLVLRQVARDHGIPVVMVPFAVSSIEADILMRRENALLRLDARPSLRLKNFVSRRWPGQVARDGCRAMLFFEPLETCALALLGLLPARPWVIGGSDPDMICALGIDHCDYLLAGGVAPERIGITGQPSLDSVGRICPSVLRAKLQARYSLDPQAPTVLCAVPQYGEHRMATWERHWQLTEELFSTLTGSGATVLLSLHPKSLQSDYTHVATRHGLTIIDERLNEVLPAVDLLVAGFSSTVRWAIGLGIPAFIVDAVGTEYGLYSDLPGVTIMPNHQSLAEKLRHFLNDHEARARHIAAAKEGASRVGRLDGQASERVARTILQAAAARPARG